MLDTYAVPPLPVASPPAAVYSPEWWRARLLARLIDRATKCKEDDDFYRGNQPMAFASKKFQEIFGSRYRQLPANFMPLVIDAERERLIVQGFRFGSSTEADKGIARIWQGNQLDAESQIAQEIALVKGVAYVLVAPPPDGSNIPLITIEDPTETILETAPGNRRLRLAALKVWLDDDGYSRAYLYLPDELYKWRSRNRRTDTTYSGLSQQTWEPLRENDEDWPAPNRLGVVPIVPLLNRPQLNGTGRSELEPVKGNQRAINKLRFDMLIASEYVAFPQRWALNIDIPTDPDTGKPIAPFKPGVDTVWTVRRPTPDEVSEYGDKVPDPALGQFPAGDLKPYIDAIDSEIGQMSSISRTPYHYLLGTPTSIPPSGESLKASEAPLVKKVIAASVHFGEGWEEVIRVALVAIGQGAKAKVDGETIWADPETRNEAAHTDAILKQYQSGLLPDEFALEELGYSPAQINRIAELRANQPPAPLPRPTVRLTETSTGPADAVAAAEGTPSAP